jgi:agmatinase|tara:strand:+ start:1001 stop:1951 length:951 start_codon:yes stop_codon:yes gene_type:complete
VNGKIEAEKTSQRYLSNNKNSQMKYLSNKNGFLGIDNKVNIKEKVIIVPFGLERTVSYGGGTKNGPKEIIKASHQVELYDEELNYEPYKKIGIKTIKPFKIDKNIKKALNKMSKINQEILDKKLFPMTFGGEHSITPGCIAPFAKRYKKICLLHFDAHADLRESYNGEKFSHASAIRRCLDYKNVSVISFGIRNISESEILFLKKNKSRINIFWAKDKLKWDLKKFKKMIKNKTVYLTFDVDGLDSSIMPATGTPEPGGLLWDETLNIIKIATKNSVIVGADINELSPIKSFNSYNFLVAKLAYKILSYTFRFKHQ